MVTAYTTALNIDPDVAEDIFQQNLYNLCVKHNVRYTQDTYVKAYSHVGMHRGMKIVINIISILEQ